jgi:hypothetical protein
MRELKNIIELSKSISVKTKAVVQLRDSRQKNLNVANCLPIKRRLILYTHGKYYEVERV